MREFLARAILGRKLSEKYDLNTDSSQPGAVERKNPTPPERVHQNDTSELSEREHQLPPTSNSDTDSHIEYHYHEHQHIHLHHYRGGDSVPVEKGSEHSIDSIDDMSMPPGLRGIDELRVRGIDNIALIHGDIHPGAYIYVEGIDSTVVYTGEYHPGPQVRLEGIDNRFVHISIAKPRILKRIQEAYGITAEHYGDAQNHLKGREPKGGTITADAFKPLEMEPDRNDEFYLKGRHKGELY